MHVPPQNPPASLYFDYPVHPFRRPPEMDGVRRRHPVAIIGGGPVGLATALELSRHGAASVVIEADATVADGSRAICIARRSMEILQQLGVAEAFAAKGLGWTGGRSFYRDRVVFELAMPHSEDERFPPMTNLQQCYMEAFLIDAAARDETIELRWQSRLTALEPRADHVVLRIDTPEGEYDLAADYVVAADGARSTVRQLMDLKLSGTSYEGRYLIADIKLESSHPVERRAWFDPPANPGSTVLMHKQPDDIWRIDYQLLDDQDMELELQEERIRARIQKQLDMVGETAPWQLEWYSLYKAHCLCLDSYRHGRVLFVGDAAHLVPIFGVRGLNSGFADANNLGWKLAYLLRGLAPGEILDTFSHERREATLDILREARKSTIFMTPPSRGYRLMRDAVLSLALSQNFPKGLINPRQSAPYDYADSRLNSFAERQHDFPAGPRVGAPLRNVRLDGDRFLLDGLGCGFTGLYFTESGEAPPEIARLFEELEAGAVPFRALVADRRAFAAYGAVDGSFYLARPDAHVCARWLRIVPDEVRQALRHAVMQKDESR